MNAPRPIRMLLTLTALITLITGCSRANVVDDAVRTSTLTPVTETHRDLIHLPLPRGKMVTSVYSFRDLTGQYKPAPSSSFSTAVTQGAGAYLMKALLDSRWFIPVEREGLQNLLTERKIIRAALENGAGRPIQIPNLVSANILLEGGIVGYDTNVKTGGAGAKYFGIGASEQYRVDQVTVNLRAVDIASGQILQSVSTTKTLYSKEVGADVFRFISFKRLLEVEMGYTRNEPAQLCVQDAIEAAVIHLIVAGLQDGNWTLSNPDDINHPVLQAYIEEQRDQRQELPEKLEKYARKRRGWRSGAHSSNSPSQAPALEVSASDTAAPATR